MNTRTKSFLGVLMACIGGGFTYLLTGRYLEISADTVVSNGEQNSTILFIVVSVFVTLGGIMLLIFTVLGDKKDQR
jgi:hypothetical protein